MTSMKDYDGEGTDAVKSALSTLQPAVVKDLSYDSHEPFDRVVYPFALPDVNTTWVILVDVPHSAINAPVQDQTFMAGSKRSFCRSWIARHSARLRANTPGGSSACKAAITRSTSSTPAPSLSAASVESPWR